jgi:hypothetical protein
MNIRTKILIAAGLCIGGTLLGRAHAGYMYLKYVWVNQTSMTASGSIGDAYNATDTVQHIGCRTLSWSGYSPQAMCYGSDAAGNSFSCSTSNTSLVQAAASIKGDSYISVSWNSSGQCTYLQVDNTSAWSPKVHQ